MGDMFINVISQENTITICKCNHPKCASDFLIALERALKKGFTSIVIRSEADTVFPNACVPIRGIIDHYEKQGINFLYEINDDSYLSTCCFVSPLNKSREELQAETAPFGKMYFYENSGQVAFITQAYIDAISHQTECGEGILGGLAWCINEVMDNVLLHSEADHGFVMAQYHPMAKKVVFCIYDDGIGIFNSLKESNHRPATELDAITLSLQEGIGDGKGQGNGLFGLYQIVRENKGTLTITSGSSSIMLNAKGEMQKYSKIPFISYQNRGTNIDFQLDLKNDINLQQAFQTLGGYDDFDVRIDNMLNDNDLYVYNVLENCQGTGTRESGRLIRNDVKNTIKRIKTGIWLDFEGVKTVSSSFIDEFIAKLVLDLGFINFNSFVRIINMEPDVKFWCERSLYMRIHDDWVDGKSNTVKNDREI